jgi:hypothetical protein
MKCDFIDIEMCDRIICCWIIEDRSLFLQRYLRVKMEESNHKEVKLMTIRQPCYSKEEFAQRGDEIYETQVRSQVETDNHGKIVAIDIETGAFEVDASEIAACDRLEARHPDAQIWIVRIGSRHVRRFGGRSRKSA